MTDETFEAVTFFTAANADQQSVQSGRCDDMVVLTEPEVTENGAVVDVDRQYIPRQAVALPEPMTADEAVAWLQDHRDQLGDRVEWFDWDAHYRRDLMDYALTLRAQFHDALQELAADIDDVADDADAETAADLQDLLDTMEEWANTLAPRQVDRTDASDPNRGVGRTAGESGVAFSDLETVTDRGEEGGIDD